MFRSIYHLDLLFIVSQAYWKNNLLPFATKNSLPVTIFSKR